MNKPERIVIKISGEQLAGEHTHGVDPDVIKRLAGEIKQIVAANVQVVIIAGGGNMVRGAEIAGNGIKRVTADQMGMLSGLINAMAITDIFESEGLATRCLSNVYAQQVAENYSFRLAEKHLENGRALVIAGGTGRPYVTHDAAAVSAGLELGCDVVLKATDVDGIYDRDPQQHPDAQRYQDITFQQVMENPEIKVMDKSALGMAMDHELPIAVFNVNNPGALLEVALDPGSGAASLVS